MSAEDNGVRILYGRRPRGQNSVHGLFGKIGDAHGGRNKHLRGSFYPFTGTVNRVTLVVSGTGTGTGTRTRTMWDNRCSPHPCSGAV